LPPPADRINLAKTQEMLKDLQFAMHRALSRSDARSRIPGQEIFHETSGGAHGDRDDSCPSMPDSRAGK
jgi:hypothetical protein